MKKNPTPHDATFRQFLTQPEIARDFVDIHLPAELRAICDLSTLKLESEMTCASISVTCSTA